MKIGSCLLIVLVFFFLPQYVLKIIKFTSFFPCFLCQMTQIFKHFLFDFTIGNRNFFAVFYAIELHWSLTSCWLGRWPGQ